MTVKWSLKYKKKGVALKATPFFLTGLILVKAIFSLDLVKFTN